LQSLQIPIPQGIDVDDPPHTGHFQPSLAKGLDKGGHPDGIAQEVACQSQMPSAFFSQALQGKEEGDGRKGMLLKIFTLQNV